MGETGVSIPKRVSEVLWLWKDWIKFYQQEVSIPKRVSEVLWLMKHLRLSVIGLAFQSLKGFQRFCGLRNQPWQGDSGQLVSIGTGSVK